MTSPPSPATPTSPATERDTLLVFPLAELKPDRMRLCTAQGREIVICRTRAGVFALDNICTHAEARLNEGRLKGTRLICPLHGAAFDVRDGRPLCGPATQALAMHAVEQVGDQIEVHVKMRALEHPS